MTDVFQPQPRPLHHEPPPLPSLRDGEDPVAHLRRCLEHAETVADQLAATGGHAREQADQHMAEARRYYDAAATARRQADWWKRVIAAAEAERANDRPALTAQHPAQATPPEPPAAVQS